MKMSYCPNCKKNVATKRKDFKFLIAFFLAFTGIGLVIYILYYIDLKPNRCVHCESICNPIQFTDQSQSQPILLTDQSQQCLECTPIPKEIIRENTNFCSNCGARLGDREGIKYCAFCGDNLD